MWKQIRQFEIVSLVWLLSFLNCKDNSFPYTQYQSYKDEIPRISVAKSFLIGWIHFHSQKKSPPNLGIIREVLSRSPPGTAASTDLTARMGKYTDAWLWLLQRGRVVTWTKMSKDFGVGGKCTWRGMVSDFSLYLLGWFLPINSSSLIEYRSHYNFSLFCSFFQFVATGNNPCSGKSFKNALLNEEANSSNPTAKAEEAAVRIEALDSPISAEEAVGEFSDESDEENAEETFHGLDPAFAEYVRQLARVEKDIKLLKETCLIGTLWRGQADSKKLKQKLILEWSFVRGGIEVVERANNWFEIHFASTMEKDMVWECRPYHVFGLLLVLMPWKESFNPDSEKIRSLELWIRILALPTEYMIFEIIKIILDFNKIGNLIKLDPYTELKSKAKYARVCVQIQYAECLQGEVILPDFKNLKVPKVFKLWYEGVSDGCVNCADSGHTFGECPRRVVMDRHVKISIEKCRARGIFQERVSGEENAEQEKASEEEWIPVVDRKGKRPMAEKSKAKNRVRHVQRAGKSLKIWDVEEKEKLEGQWNTQTAMATAAFKGGVERQTNNTEKIILASSESSDAVVPSISKNMPPSTTMNDHLTFPMPSGDMTGLDRTIFYFCGNLPLGSIQKDGGYMLQDIINSCNLVKDQNTQVMMENEEEETDLSYKSTHSRSSMVHKLNNMCVRKEDTSMSDSEKRKQPENEDDTTSSAMKRAKNTDP